MIVVMPYPPRPAPYQGPSPHPCSGQHSRSSRSHTRRWLQGQAAGVEQGTADSHCNMAAEQTLSEHGMLVANHSRLSHLRVVILQHKGAGSAGSGHNHERCCNVRLHTHVDDRAYHCTPHLHRTQAMALNVDDIIDTSSDAVVVVTVSVDTIPDEVSSTWGMA